MGLLQNQRLRRLASMKLSKTYYHHRRVLLNWLTAIVSMVRWAWPQRGMTLLAVTGTDGKTTTVQLLASILRQTGQPFGIISTVGATINGQVIPLAAHVSTPGPAEIYRLLYLMRQARVKWVVVETTSHGLDQRRVAGLRFAVGVITNISPEHLDYHGTIEAYVAAKARLINLSHVIVLNDADERLRKLIHRSKRVVLFGTARSSVYATSIDIKADRTTFLLHTEGRSVKVSLRLPGIHNVSNALAAATVAMQIGIDEVLIVKGLASLEGVAGRWQVVQAQPFLVVVDFGHTPQAFEQILPLAKSLVRDKGRLIHVFGSAGGRDAQKRSHMGRLSGEVADISVVTMEDPRHEPLDIIQQQLIAGLKQAQKGPLWRRIDDRRAAITWAIMQARAGDVVLLTGKGHEQSMNINGLEMPWDEVTEVQMALKELNSGLREEVF
jgi:UDP-N-acetylmuramoyl-L-alanyl-D-glutamate--2,6-diaminopimelate ligase